MKITYRRVIAFLILIALSVGFGFAFDGVATAIEKGKYPIVDRYATEIRGLADRFGIPEHILWAAVKCESDFVSNLVSESGEIGLMQLTPERFAQIGRDILKENALDPGMLYDPSTNLRYGAAYLSDLYRRYGVWDTVFAAYHAGEACVDAWLADPAHVSAQGRLQDIPDPDTVDYLDRMNSALKLYQRLYFGAP